MGLAVTNAICSYAYATTQEKDEIIYETKTYTIEEVPLNNYLEKLDPIPEFDVPNTANYKGYTAKWEIKDNKLCLIKFQAKRDNQEVQISEIFPDSETLPVEATWYNGKITINLEELLFHYGEFLSPTTLVLTIENGKIINKEKQKNKKLITSQ